MASVFIHLEYSKRLLLSILLFWCFPNSQGQRRNRWPLIVTGLPLGYATSCNGPWLGRVFHSGKPKVLGPNLSTRRAFTLAM